MSGYPHDPCPAVTREQRRQILAAVFLMAPTDREANSYGWLTELAGMMGVTPQSTSLYWRVVRGNVAAKNTPGLPVLVRMSFCAGISVSFSPEMAGMVVTLQREDLYATIPANPPEGRCPPAIYYTLCHTCWTGCVRTYEDGGFKTVCHECATPRQRKHPAAMQLGRGTSVTGPKLQALWDSLPPDPAEDPRPTRLFSSFNDTQRGTKGGR